MSCLALHPSMPASKPRMSRKQRRRVSLPRLVVERSRCPVCRDLLPPGEVCCACLADSKLDSRQGLAELLMMPSTSHSDPNARPGSVIDAFIAAEDHLAGVAVFTSDREVSPETRAWLRSVRGPWPRGRMVR